MSQSDPRSPKQARRLLQLERALNAAGSLHIRDAAALLEVSEMTVRRDLRENPEQFQFLGGHIMLPADAQRRAPYELAQAGQIQAEAKRAACAACLPLVKPGQTLFVDCGTTLPHLIGLLPEGMDLTVICYALNTADAVARRADVRLVLLGGEYHAPTASFYPAEEDRTLDAYAINLAFLSAAGVDARLGVTCTTFPEAKLKQAAMSRAQRRILVADRSKIGLVRAARFADLSRFDGIATEDGLTTEPEKMRP
ncbi:DeoR family transcriptional regulator [Pacificoceanicola onchidii]|uniref:DeoR family transcriptional regulator n=1 Tax=Pacificoceanicola onchidii TaxID=2562685 RepID=UPI0010A5DDE4|nr:DeoR family transcriptional regulator [Pacificoceanicola onchidii]